MLPGDIGHWCYYLLTLEYRLAAVVGRAIIAVGQCRTLVVSAAVGMIAAACTVLWWCALHTARDKPQQQRPRRRAQRCGTSADCGDRAASPANRTLAERFAGDFSDADSIAVETYQDLLPTLRTGTGVWYYRSYSRNRGFVCGFIGPLGYHYNYRSDRNENARWLAYPTVDRLVMLA